VEAPARPFLADTRFPPAPAGGRLRGGGVGSSGGRGGSFPGALRRAGHAEAPFEQNQHENRGFRVSRFPRLKSFRDAGRPMRGRRRLTSEGENSFHGFHQVSRKGFPLIVASIRALAPLLGMSHTALNGHLKRGKFQAEPAGGYDPEKVGEALKRNADLEQPSQAKGARSPRNASNNGSHVEASVMRKYNRARASRENSRAKREELDLKARSGELVSAAEVAAAWSELVTTTRNQMLLIPDKVAPKVAVLTDVLECRTVIEREVRQALQALSEHEPDIA
jgi:hypothetical protein